MGYSKKIHKFINAVNTYYGFGSIVFATVWFVAAYYHIWIWVALIATPVFAGWTGFLLKSVIERRNQRHGFSIVSDTMTYELNPNRTYKLKYSTHLTAQNDHLMVYPIGYQWSGSGQEFLPKIAATNQHLLAIVTSNNHKNRAVQATPYTAAMTTEGTWNYWFVAFNPPVHKGDNVHIEYSQDFHDKKNTAAPSLYYFVRIPMKKLELRVKFANKLRPTHVQATYTKLNNPNRPYPIKKLHYSPDKQWVTLSVRNPKRGHAYRISWDAA